ncbi:hypothetical protein [Marinicella sp. W31]|uniref:hypothetical protein n=1 Tax=Marinicella sp. W31 TaxID=3023713 RepID=UPI003757609D
MPGFFEILRWIHIAAGFIGLAAFWIPVFTRKGGVNHRLYGKVFKYCAYVVLAAAAGSITIRVPMALADGITPITHPESFAFLAFLGYLTLVTFVGMRHGFQVLGFKGSLEKMNTPLNRLLAMSSIVASMLIIAFALYYGPSNKILLYALSPIGFLGGFGILKVISQPQSDKRMWFYEHMGSILGTGIAFHTAFAVFGASRLFDLGLSGFAAVIPWITPTLIGIPAIFLWTRHYRKKFATV